MVQDGGDIVAPPALASITRALLMELGEDPSREGLKDTPARVARSLSFLTQGYSVDPRAVVGEAIFDATYDEMVVVRDIEIYSLCEHHLLPFFGRCHIAYLPDGKIVGLSKLARLADVYARRLQVQERMTKEIAESIDEILSPKGVAVVIEAHHLCMMMRGAEKQNSMAVTSCMLGRFKQDARTRSEFLDLIGKRG
ncbi:MAG: GTP cyclohydrolase I FolE [Dehalococcoidia bacterium]|nr:GTP cyclohydrolase I FolE [Dehalococcoidia bacterium]